MSDPTQYGPRIRKAWRTIMQIRIFQILRCLNCLLVARRGSKGNTTAVLSRMITGSSSQELIRRRPCICRGSSVRDHDERHAVRGEH